MEITHYLEPYKGSHVLIPGFELSDALAARVSFFTGNDTWFSVAYNIVVLGVTEARNATDNIDCAHSPDKIREWLYALRSFSGMPVIGDAGNVKGNGLNDRWSALREVIDYFTGNGTVIMILGGSHDLSVPVVNALSCSSGAINLVVADAMLDIDTRNEDFSNRSWISYLLSDHQRDINDLTLIGVQGYLTSMVQEKFLDDRFLDIIRLGQVRGNAIDKTEIPLRDADFVSFDYRAVAGQPQVNDEMVSHLGFNPFEACQVCRYAGLSDRLKIFGLFEVPLKRAGGSDPAILAAQMAWHFLEGVTGRYGDYPVKSITEYRCYVVPIETEIKGLEFYLNQTNGRWWMKIPPGDDGEVVSCGREDYRSALKREYPDKWWRYLMRKTMVEKDYWPGETKS